MEYGQGGWQKSSLASGIPGNETVILWMINKVYDNYGNYIEYEYKTDYGQIRIDKIRYTGNSEKNISPYNTILFHYKERTDKNRMFIANAGRSIHNNLLLDKIEVKTIGNRYFRTYQMTYGYDLYSFLTQVQETGLDGEKLNPTRFKYGEKGEGFNYSAYASFPSDNSKDIITGDFNGNGYTDIIAAPFFYSEDDNLFRKVHTGFSLYTNNQGEFSNTPSWSHIPSPNEIFEIMNAKVNLNQNDYHASFLQHMSSDFNGDGMDDLFVMKRELDDDYLKLSKVLIYYSNGTDFELVEYPSPNQFRVLHPSFNHIYVGDFDGDGAMDFLTLLSNGNTYRGFITYPKNNLHNIQIEHDESVFFGTAIAQADAIYVIDFDGDGKSDLMVINDNTTTIFSFTRTGNNIIPKVLHQSGYPTKHHLIYPGDFNGDGKTDFLNAFDIGTGTYVGWNIAYSTGIDFVSEPFVDMQHVYLGPIYQKHDRLTIADVNGDGKSDILHYSIEVKYIDEQINLLNFEVIPRIYLSNGFSFSYYTSSPFESLGFDQSHFMDNFFNSFHFVGDFTGDGSVDAVIHNFDFPDNLTLMSIHHPKNRHLSIEAIKDGFNNKTTFRYNPLTASEPLYKKGNEAEFPLNDISLPIYVVSEMETPDGIGGESLMKYQYESALFHRQGKGFLGFKKQTVKNLNSGLKTTMMQEVDTDHYLLLPHKQLTSLSLTDDPQQDELISAAESATSVIDLPHGRYLVQTTQSREKDYMHGLQTDTDYTYDNHGNVTKVFTEYTVFGESLPSGNIQDNRVEFSESEFVYDQFGSWIPSSVVTSTQTSKREGQQAYLRTANYSYNANGSLISETADPGDEKSVTSTYGYDDFGNVIETKLIAANLPERSSSVKMDGLGRFPIKTTNLMGQHETMTYHPHWGSILTATDINGLKTSYEYDNLGRVKKVTDPLGVTSTEEYLWDIGPGGEESTPTEANNTVFRVKTSRSGTPDANVWYDSFQRKRKLESEGFNGLLTKVVKTYDNQGRLVSRTSPFSTPNEAVVTQYTYDEYSRILTEHTDDIGTTSYSYSAGLGLLKETVTNPANQTVETVTEVASGSPFKSTDDGGVLTYTYWSSGQQKEVKLNDVVVASMDYDLQGNQTVLNDANAGTIVYAYNAFGELIHQTNPNGHEYEMIYDDFGRLMSKKVGQETTTYEYISSGNGLNQLKKETAPNGYDVSYDYDPFGRLTALTEDIAGELFTQSFLYNQNSQITQLTYPSGFTLQKHYDDKGFLTTITDNSGETTIFTLENINHLGQYTEYSLGNGLTTERFYTKHGLPELFSTQGVYELSMNFDLETGNMKYRKNEIISIQEDFEYDPLNRLEKAKIGTNQLVMGYSPNGNILSKSDMGTYAYDPQKPNAVAEITLNAGVPAQQPHAISYTTFNKAKEILQENKALTIHYGADEQRRKSVYTQDGEEYKTIYHLGNYEKISMDENTYEVHYISCGAGLVAMNVTRKWRRRPTALCLYRPPGVYQHDYRYRRRNCI
jgi:YD repeat-containing protein